MASFKPVQRKRLPRLKGEPTADDKYWTDFNFPVSVKEHGPIQSVSFSRTKPYYFAVTTSAKVHVFNPNTLETHKTFSRFKEAAYGAELRADGRLLAAGGDEGIVRIFDVATKSLLREFKNHKAPVHCTRFSPDNTHVVSFGDDRSVRYFDIPSQTQVRSFKNHGDYVRAGDVSMSSHNFVVSGSYDHKARLFDVRTEGDSVLEVDHGAPVEAVLVFPSGNVFMTAGGTNIKVWDIVAGGSCLTSLSHHHKTITDLCFASGYSRFLSSSIDRHVKVYDVASYSLVHSMDFPTPVLSIGVSMDDEVMCVGMTDGLISIHKRKEPKDEEEIALKKSAKRRGNRYLAREKYITPDEGAVIVKEEDKLILAQYDKHLRRFEFTKALDCVLKYHVWAPKPDITVQVIQELDRMNGLLPAIVGRQPEQLVDLLGFLCRYITDPRFFTVILGVADLFFEQYPWIYGKSKQVDTFINRLQEILTLEIDNQKELKLIVGNMDALFSASRLNSAEAQAELLNSQKPVEILPLQPVAV
ncbi:U3 small nucleolar RNA-associated protein 15-like protein [Hypsibius exemplaris]|uniref:U3 small nucleolar RNA-associated protein 15 homolog n=1 Tax=Hypsibius exemplaris TaxID=2072580 RepID=A0A9X6NII0_HYPEX|nr:U3 small nucleolar RNA-associated protein 15-like protein [Hypsibius exemplaris]